MPKIQAIDLFYSGRFSLLTKLTINVLKKVREKTITANFYPFLLFYIDLHQGVLSLQEKHVFPSLHLQQWKDTE